jgi:hypothetical protein
MAVAHLPHTDVMMHLVCGLGTRPIAQVQRVRDVQPDAQIVEQILDASQPLGRRPGARRQCSQLVS